MREEITGTDCVECTLNYTLFRHQQTARMADKFDVRLIPAFDGENAPVQEWLDKAELV